MGLEAYYVDDRKTDAVRYERNHLTLIARDDQGFRNLVKLTSAGFLEGYKRGKANVDMELLSQYSEGVIALTGCLASRFCQRLAEDNRHEARAHADELMQVFGSDNLYFEVQKNGIALQDKVNEGIVEHRPRGGPAGGGHGRRALPGPRGLPQPLGAAVRADQEHAGRAEDVLRHQRVLPQGHGRDDGGVRGVARGGAHHAGDRRALPGGHRARQHAHPQLPDARRAARGRVPARPGAGRAARALRRPHPRRGGGAPGHGARGHRPDGLRRLLPDRLGLRQVRQGQRHRGGAGPWLGGRLDRVLRAGHHRGRPAQVRPAVRALPQPRARVHAGHRHRLLGQGPRAGHALRREQVRPRVGGPDRDLRQDAAAQRHPRRRARARQGLRGRRPAGQAHPRAGHGPLAVAGQVPGRGARAQEGLRHRGRGARGHRHRPRARGHRAQRRRARRRGRDRRPAAHRHRAAAADGGPRRRVRGRRARLQGHHAVLDGADRGAGPAQDGLPGPAQPGRHRELPADHREGRGRAAGHGVAAAGRPQDLRDDVPRRLDRRVPVRVRGHARDAAQGQAQRVRGLRGAERPVPPGRDGLHRHLRAQQAQAAGDRVHRRAAAPDHRGHLRRDALPGAAHADLQVDRRVHAAPRRTTCARPSARRSASRWPR